MVRRGGDNGRAGGTGSDLTRARILDATLQCIRDAGIVGASARAIARTGGFNQASIYYHFGSINDAVLAAVRELGDERAGRYRDRLSGVSSLAELVRVAVELHREDVESGTLRVMAQVMAGAAADEPFGEALGDLFDPWLDVVVEALEQFAGPGGALAPLRQVLPLGELGYAISALFVGVETMRALRS
ncbi:MAG: TetR/AcrR family transcriptional regulator, partial [Acidimicrobiia bacterium]|nr:TetR/AcrR family transcriptional regulator [Acidimicrobiia bacterium]